MTEAPLAPVPTDGTCAGAARTGAPARPPLDIEDIAAFVRCARGVDMAAYRPTTVERRLRARMQHVGAFDEPAYLDVLRSTPLEVDELLRYVRIGVTRFMRNAAAFAMLASEAIPTLVDGARSRPLRVWSAGCSTGEEPYSLLMLLDDVLGDGRPEVALVASDVEASVVQRLVARRVTYGPEALEELTAPLRERYLERACETALVYRPSQRLEALGAAIRWVEHDLLSGTMPAPGCFDLVSCRNVLIYFTTAEQRRVQALLAESLAPGGYLFLGEAEALHEGVSHRFDVVDRGARLFRLRADARGGTQA